ncbi:MULTISPECIES: DUF5681 domain-containing protein [unclassified Bradyrhizobium]
MSPDDQRSGGERKRQLRPPRRRKSIEPPLSIAHHFRRLASEEIELEREGKRVRMSRWDAYVQQLYTMALNKDIGASRLLAKIRKRFPGEELPGEVIVYHLSESDMEL